MPPKAAKMPKAGPRGPWSHASGDEAVKATSYTLETPVPGDCLNVLNHIVDSSLCKTGGVRESVDPTLIVRSSPNSLVIPFETPVTLRGARIWIKRHLPKKVAALGGESHDLLLVFLDACLFGSGGAVTLAVNTAAQLGVALGAVFGGIERCLSL